MSDCVSEWV